MGFVDAEDTSTKTGGEGYGYTEEEWLLKQTIRKFCEEEIEPRWMEGWDSDHKKEKAFIKEFLKKLGDMGVLRLTVPEELGGYGQRYTQMMIATEEVARIHGGLAIHVMEQQMYAQSMARWVPAAFEKWGEGVMSGDILLAGSACSPEGQCNYGEIADIGKLEGDTWVLNGAKAYSSGGSICDLLRITGLVDGTMHHWYMVPDETPGLTVGVNPEIGTHPTSGSFTMNNVRIPKEMGGIMPAVVDRKFKGEGADVFSLSVSAMSLGCMAAAFDKTVEYLTHRTVNFKPIASLGSIQYKLVNMKAKLEASRSLFLVATNLLEAGHKDAALYGRLSKGFVGDAARDICEECIQLYGNSGYNPETGIARHLLDAIGFGIGCSGTELQYAQAAYLMGLPGAEPAMP